MRNGSSGNKVGRQEEGGQTVVTTSSSVAGTTTTLLVGVLKLDQRATASSNAADPGRKIDAVLESCPCSSV